MKDKLIQYVELLFAGAEGAEDMKQEILQNTLDRYDDLVAQGKSPEAAYSLAIAGIGDITEILGKPQAEPVKKEVPAPVPQEKAETPMWKKLMRAGAVFLYIISAIPLFILTEFGMETLGLCCTIAIAAVATVLILLSGDGRGEKKQKPEREEPRDPAYKIIDSVLTVVMFVLYFGISFRTGAWYITWLIFPIFACIDGVVKAIFDLKEGDK